MIPKGLKVGDTFKDGELTYKVLKVVGENYESQVVEEPVGFSYAEKKDYNDLPYAELKKLCAEKGLNAKGTKPELIARLEG